MKMIVQRIKTGTGLPFLLEDLKTHFRVSHDDEDAAIAGMGLTAAEEIEHFSALALLSQTIRVTLLDVNEMFTMRLPVGPVADGAAASVTVNGAVFEGPKLVPGTRPWIEWIPYPEQDGPWQITIEYPAGFGPTVEHIPADLAQAVMDQALVMYEGRGVDDERARKSSPHMARIGAKYRGVRL